LELLSQEFLLETVFLDLEGGVGKVAEGVEDIQIFGRGSLEEAFEGVVAVVAEGVKELKGSDLLAGAAEVGQVDIAVLLGEFDDGFNGGFGAVEGFQVFKVVLVTALDPIGEVLGVKGAAVLAQLVDDDMVREAVIEHAVEHEPDLQGEAGDFAVAPEVFGRGLLGGQFVGEEVEFGGGGHRMDIGLLNVVGAARRGAERSVPT
jgi:hypothetical protein